MNTYLMRLNIFRKQVFTGKHIGAFFLGVLFFFPLFCLMPALQEFLYLIPGIKEVFLVKESQHLFRDVWLVYLENPEADMRAARFFILVVYPVCTTLLALILWMNKETRIVRKLRQVLTVEYVTAFFLGVFLCLPLLCLGIVIQEAVAFKTSFPLISEIWFSCFKRHWTESLTARSLIIPFGGVALLIAVLFLILPAWKAISLKDSTSSCQERWQIHFNEFKARILTWRFVGFFFLSITLSLFLVCLIMSSMDALCSKAWPTSQTTPELISSTTTFQSRQ